MLTVSATAPRITAATVAPTCGIRSSRPVITPSTMGNGRPNAHADRAATVPATTEIARLPSSEEETARMDSSTTGRQRCSTAGGANPNSQSVMVGPLHHEEEREERQRDEGEDGAEQPAGDAQQRVRGLREPRGQVLERGRDLVVRPGGGGELLEARAVGELVPVSGERLDELRDLVPHRSRRQQHERADGDEQTKNTVSAALPRFQPRRWSAPTTGSSPSAITAARKIEISVPSDRIASATSAQTPSSTSNVRTPTTTSTRCGAGPSMVTARYARHRRPQRDQATSTSTATTNAIRSSAPESAPTIQPGALASSPPVSAWSTEA